MVGRDSGGDDGVLRVVEVLNNISGAWFFLSHALSDNPHAAFFVGLLRAGSAWLWRRSMAVQGRQIARGDGGILKPAQASHARHRGSGRSLRCLGFRRVLAGTRGCDRPELALLVFRGGHWMRAHPQGKRWCGGLFGHCSVGSLGSSRVRCFSRACPLVDLDIPLNPVPFGTDAFERVR